jgi:site-specific recombinase
MSDHAKSGDAGSDEDGLSAAELNLGKVLALVHHVLPHIDEADHAMRVQRSLKQALECLENALDAHALETGVVVSSDASASADSETVAVIAAALVIFLGRPYKLVSVRPLAVPAPHLNVWAIEGRTQIFLSHKVR